MFIDVVVLFRFYTSTSLLRQLIINNSADEVRHFERDSVDHCPPSKVTNDYDMTTLQSAINQQLSGEIYKSGRSGWMVHNNSKTR